MKQPTNLFYKIFFHISKCLICNAEKTLNIANFINRNMYIYIYTLYIYIYIYTNMYIPILYVTRMNQNKNYLINSILQHGCVVNNNCCVVFPTSRFPYLILCPR